jgi:hypothetical protein
MKLASRFLMVAFLMLTFGFVAFCLLFGLPFVSQFAAGKVIAMAGCTTPSFDMQATCPAGSYAEPFIPLSHWFTSFLAPLVLIENFGVMLIAWAAICFAVGLLWLVLKSASSS